MGGESVKWHVPSNGTLDGTCPDAHVVLKGSGFNLLHSRWRCHVLYRLANLLQQVWVFRPGGVT